MPEHDMRTLLRDLADRPEPASTIDLAAARRSGKRRLWLRNGSITAAIAAMVAVAIVVPRQLVASAPSPNSTATGTKDRHGGLEAASEVAELVIHGHAERLEHPGGRVDLAGAARLHARDEAAEFVRGDERPPGPAADDRAGDARGLGLLTELGEDPPEVALFPGVHQVGRRERKARVGPHVEGS